MFSEISEIFRSCQNRCLKALRLENPVQDAGISGLIVGLVVFTTLFLDVHCFFYVIPSLFKEFQIPPGFFRTVVYFLTGYLIPVGILGHLYVLSKDKLITVSALLKIDYEPSCTFRRGGEINHENPKVRRGRMKGYCHQLGEVQLHTRGKRDWDDQFQQLGLILYTVNVSFSAFLLCLLNIIKTEGFVQSLLIVKGFLAMSFHLGSIVTILCGIIFVASYIFLFAYLKKAMIRSGIGSTFTFDSILNLVCEIVQYQCLACLIFPDIVKAYRKGSFRGGGLLPPGA